MPLQKNSLPLPFGIGLDTITDPWQVRPGKLLALSNVIFDKAGQLKKRNGFSLLTSLPDGANPTTLTTFNDNLTAIGKALYAFSEETSEWFNKGRFQPLALSTQALIRSAYSQTNCDAAVAPSGLVCTVYLDGDGLYKYQVADSITSQSLVGPISLPATSTAARTSVLGGYFVITFLATVAGLPRLQYISIPLTNLTTASAATTISSQVSSLSAGYDAYVSGNILYLAWNGNDGGGAIRLTYLDQNLVVHPTTAVPGFTATNVSVTTDVSAATPVLWVTIYNGTTVKSAAFSTSLGTILAFTTVITATGTQVTSSASGSILTVFFQTTNTYTFSAVRTDYIQKNTITQAGVVGTASTMLRSVGIASKAFLVDSVIYLLAVYAGTYQPTYFLIDSTGDTVGKIAYSNGGGYITAQVLPSVTVYNEEYQLAYLFRDQISPVNKSQGAAAVSGVYSQTGVNLASIELSPSNLSTAEIGQNLHIAGGFLWMYDGYGTTEHSYHYWPEDVAYTTATTGGSLAAQVYFYQVVYEYTDYQGNIHRSSPSIPLEADISTSATSTNTITLNIPTLRLTYKQGVRICIYRWSTAQQNYYLVTSITSPLLNTISTDSVTYTDTQADSSIIGNLLIYTTGGVVENIAAPACTAISLYKSRLMLVSAEDRNVVWFSKQVIETVPVEMSDLFTKYIPPTVGVQGSTGDLQFTAGLDDNFICFKANALYYFNGNGPDNTGNNNDFSEPSLITSTVGSDNPSSLVFLPNGILFDSAKGRWLLGRNLSTSYLGAPVAQYETARAVSALTIPGTNQIRIALNTGITLLYDYFFDQWGTFQGIPSISSTMYQGKHTFLNSFGQVCQEQAEFYQDITRPVLISFTTAWLNLMGLQGYERSFFFFLLGQYLSPHKLSIQVAYDYNPSPTQSMILYPNNYAANYGSGSFYGDVSVYGGAGDVEDARVFFNQQRCQAFQITISELFDPTFGTMPGAGLTLSGLNIIFGAKKAYRTQPAATSVG